MIIKIRGLRKKELLWAFGKEVGSQWRFVGVLLVGALLMPSPLVTGGGFAPSGAQQANFAITGSTGKVLALGVSERAANRHPDNG
ncbi:hypothetical protein ATTO_00890 [Leptogranulimonas caecicola]|uniref:Uncharacterized protein n=1 Tax=Leptogranulimonas caecicola TaxID=2894156 RepID=A0AAU9C8R6_9ACTN|nr:hypothetical protein ATTO_00890 [Leptogranulimonas caecicola]